MLRIDARWVRVIVFSLVLLAAGGVLFRLAPLSWPVLQLFLIAALLTLALDTPVRWLTRNGMPRWAAVLLILLLLLVLLLALGAFLLPPLLAQFSQFVTAAPALWQSAIEQWSLLTHRLAPDGQIAPLNTVLLSLFREAGTWLQAARTIFTTAVGAVTGAVVIFVITVYLLLDPRPILLGLRGLFPTAWWETVTRIATAAADRIRRWVMGTLVLALVVGVLDYLGLALINLVVTPDLPFIYLFAILGGVLEVIPVVGPIIAAVIPALVGFSLHPVLGLLVLLVFFLVQQLENNLLVPLIMRRALALHPVSLIFSLMILSALLGIFGAIIAVPVAAVVKVLYDEWYYPLLHEDEKPPGHT